MKIEKISINQIERDKLQPRQNFKDINELVNSILKEGLMEPLKVRKEGDGYILVDGERRFRALNILFKTDKEFYEFIDCIVVNPKEIFITQLSTDLHKRRLNPFEEAEAFKKLIDSGWEISDLKSRLGISGSIITRRIKLLGLDGRTKEMIKEGIIPQSVVSEIDFKSFKNNEPQILNRIKSEVGFNRMNKSRDKIKRIIKEETEKQKAVLNHLNIDLTNFSRVISSYEFKLDEFKLDEFINEPIKDVQKVLSETLSRINKLVEIKDKVKEIEEQLNNLKIKYGEKTEISKEMLSDQNEPLKVNNNNKMKFASQRNSETEVNRNE